MEFEQIDKLIALALQEDLGSPGDITSNFTLSDDATASAKIVAKESGVIAGIPVASRVFRKVDEHIRFDAQVGDGAKVRAGDVIVKIFGPVRGILAAERTALNFLQRLSGIATLTSKFVEKTAGTRAKILDTRKTTPGWRYLEKYAVRAGGGYNHRLGLYDMILIKENHVVAGSSITNAVERIRREISARNLHLAIEVESRTLDEVAEALTLSVDRIMLDNMPLWPIREAVKMVNGRVALEVSGGVTLETVREIAETGVDYISIGALTHSAKALDLTLLLQ